MRTPSTARLLAAATTLALFALASPASAKPTCADGVI